MLLAFIRVISIIEKRGDTDYEKVIAFSDSMLDGNQFIAGSDDRQ
jgi:hypothetical protein